MSAHRVSWDKNMSASERDFFVGMETQPGNAPWSNRRQRVRLRVLGPEGTARREREFQIARLAWARVHDEDAVKDVDEETK